MTLEEGLCRVGTIKSDCGQDDREAEQHCLGLILFDADGHFVSRWNSIKHLVCRRAFVVVDDMFYRLKLSAYHEITEFLRITPCARVMGVYGWGTMFMKIDCKVITADENQLLSARE